MNWIDILEHIDPFHIIRDYRRKKESERKANEAFLRAYNERKEAEKREQLKREKIREMKAVVHDARIWEILNESGLEYTSNDRSVTFPMPCGMRILLEIRKFMPFIEINHYIEVVRRFRDVLSKYSQYIMNGQMDLGRKVKVERPKEFSCLSFTLPYGYDLVLVFPSDELKTYRPLVNDILQDITDVFNTLMQRPPKRYYDFALVK